MAVGLDKEEAKQMANAALRGGSKRKPGSAGGQGGSTKPITIIEDSCDETNTLECDSSYKYRAIEGQCNNLDSAFDGSAGMAFTRYATVADNMDPVKNITTIWNTPLPSSRGSNRKGKPGGSGSGDKECGTSSGKMCFLLFLNSYQILLYVT